MSSTPEGEFDEWYFLTHQGTVSPEWTFDDDDTGFKLKEVPLVEETLQ